MDALFTSNASTHSTSMRTPASVSVQLIPIALTVSTTTQTRASAPATRKRRVQTPRYSTERPVAVSVQSLFRVHEVQRTTTTNASVSVQETRGVQEVAYWIQSHASVGAATCLVPRIKSKTPEPAAADAQSLLGVISQKYSIARLASANARKSLTVPISRYLTTKGVSVCVH